MKSNKTFCLWLVLLLIHGSVIAGENTAQIRIRQTGYTPDETKSAILMSPKVADGIEFNVVAADGSTVLSGPAKKLPGVWNKNFPHLYSLDFSALKAPGMYTIKTSGDAPAVSPAFKIATGSELYVPLLKNALFFFLAQRDGPDVLPAVIKRAPAHLSDAQAFTYKVPVFGKNGFQGGLEKTGGPIDVSGGWFDAGDYVKFVQTASYTTAMMLTAVRDYRAQTSSAIDVASESRRGLDWLLKMWQDDTRVLYCQVGIGDGNEQVTGDHDLWRLPEADDKLDVKPGDPQYFVKYRPVFSANPPGATISPNLAGRVAAAFALGCQVFKASDPAYANKLLVAAEHIYAAAETNKPGELVSTYPHEFYPEDQWRDDMEWGAVELYLALSAAPAPAGLPEPDPEKYLAQAAHWAKAYADNAGTGDSVNLYDVSGLAHRELYLALAKAGNPAGFETDQPRLVSWLKNRLAAAQKQSTLDSFGLGTKYTGGDVVPRTLGVSLECAWYEDLTQSKEFSDLGRRQLDFVLGKNAWGATFIVGAGVVFPCHLHHQVANLAGSLDGTSPLLLGAVVAGPEKGKGKSGDVPDGARPTPWPGGKDPFAALSGSGVRFVDDVASWANVEPANDYTVPTLLIFARLASH